MFNPDNADLSGIGGKKDLVVSDALHKAFVEVSKFGQYEVFSELNFVYR